MPSFATVLTKETQCIGSPHVWPIYLLFWMLIYFTVTFIFIPVIYLPSITVLHTTAWTLLSHFQCFTWRASPRHHEMQNDVSFQPSCLVLLLLHILCPCCSVLYCSTSSWSLAAGVFSFFFFFFPGIERWKTRFCEIVISSFKKVPKNMPPIISKLRWTLYKRNGQRMQDTTFLCCEWRWKSRRNGTQRDKNVAICTDAFKLHSSMLCVFFLLNLNN